MQATEYDQREVVAWRRDQLTGAGFSLPLAAQIAGDGRYDLHALIELTERGCAPVAPEGASTTRRSPACTRCFCVRRASRAPEGGRRCPISAATTWTTSP